MIMTIAMTKIKYSRCDYNNNMKNSDNNNDNKNSHIPRYILPDRIHDARFTNAEYLTFLSSSTRSSLCMA